MMVPFADIVASSPDAIMSICPAGLITSWNESAERLLGYSHSEMMGQPVSRLVIEAGNTAAEAHVSDTKPAPGSATTIARRRHKDGREVKFHLTNSRIVDERGEVLGRAEILRLCQTADDLAGNRPALGDVASGDTQATDSFTSVAPKRQVEDQLHQNYFTYLNLIQNAPFGIYLVDAKFTLAQVSAGAKKAFINVHPLIGRDFSEVMRILWPDAVASDMISHFRHTLESGIGYRAPSLIDTRKDIGQVESYDWQIERVIVPDGEFGVVCYFYDLTQRQKYEEHIRQLMYEVNHRSKNLLGVVQSIARQTIIANPEDFISRFSDRLQALAANQDLLIKNDWHGVGVEELVRAQLAHIGDLIGTRIRISGPPIQLMAGTAQGIGMALHELATNAGKYGALSNSKGRIEISWTSDNTEFSIEWAEQGGPPVAEPTRRGFGHSVISTLAQASVAGNVILDYASQGVVWKLRCPVERAIGEAV